MPRVNLGFLNKSVHFEDQDASSKESVYKNHFSKDISVILILNCIIRYKLKYIVVDMRENLIGRHKISGIKKKKKTQSETTTTTKQEHV